MWSKLGKYTEPYACRHLWQEIKSKDGITIYRCKICDKIKNLLD